MAKRKHKASKVREVMAEMNAPWMRVAQALEGEAELAGRASNPRIVEMFRIAEVPDQPAFKKDETAWCAAFANACLRCPGYAATKSALALRLSAPWAVCRRSIASSRRSARSRRSRGSDSADHRQRDPRRALPRRGRVLTFILRTSGWPGRR